MVRSQAILPYQVRREQVCSVLDHPGDDGVIYGDLRTNAVLEGQVEGAELALELLNPTAIDPLLGGSYAAGLSGTAWMPSWAATAPPQIDQGWLAVRLHEDGIGMPQPLNVSNRLGDSVLLARALGADHVLR